MLFFPGNPYDFIMKILSGRKFTVAQFAFWCYRHGYDDIFEGDVNSERFTAAIIAFHEYCDEKCKSKRCQNCKYWQKTDGDANYDGQCRRHTPRILNNLISQRTVFPETCKDDWCGEFQSESVEI